MSSQILAFGRCLISLVARPLVFGLCVMVAPLHAQTIELNSMSLYVEVSEKHGYRSRWRPKPLDANMPQIHDFAGPAQRIMQLGGVIGGEELGDLTQKFGGWDLVGRALDFVHLKLVNTVRGYELHKSLRLDSERPWQAKYSVWLKSNNNMPIDASLWLDIGPGLGQAPTEGLGAAQSLFSFTEGVVESNKTVTRISAPPNVMSVEDQEQSDWIGLQTRYFAFVASATPKATAWELTAPESAQWYPKHPEFEQTMRLKLPEVIGNQDPIRVQIFGGGKSYSVLKSAAPPLNELVFSNLWRWMRTLTIALMYGLDLLYALVGNWGLAILFLAGLVRLLIHPVAKRTMAAQRQFAVLQEKIKPELLDIKQKYRGGEQSEAILQLYEKHNTSPLAGLKPLLIVLLQLPVFVALYHLLGEHFELRDQSFLWMKSLAEPDQLFSFAFDVPFFGSYFNVLPVFMALTTLLTIKLSPAPAGNIKVAWKQNLMLAGLAIGFFLLFYTFPSGMVLYWTAANLLHLLHAFFIRQTQ